MVSLFEHKNLRVKFKVAYATPELRHEEVWDWTGVGFNPALGGEGRPCLQSITMSSFCMNILFTHFVWTLYFVWTFWCEQIILFKPGHQLPPCLLSLCTRLWHQPRVKEKHKLLLSSHYLCTPLHTFPPVVGRGEVCWYRLLPRFADKEESTQTVGWSLGRSGAQPAIWNTTLVGGCNAFWRWGRKKATWGGWGGWRPGGRGTGLAPGGGPGQPGWWDTVPCSLSTSIPCCIPLFHSSSCFPRP